MNQWQISILILIIASISLIAVMALICTLDSILNIINKHRVKKALTKFFHGNAHMLRKLIHSKRFPERNASNYWKFHEIVKTNTFHNLSESQKLRLISDILFTAKCDEKELICILPYLKRISLPSI